MHYSLPACLACAPSSLNLALFSPHVSPPILSLHAFSAPFLSSLLSPPLLLPTPTTHTRSPSCLSLHKLSHSPQLSPRLLRSAMEKCFLKARAMWLQNLNSVIRPRWVYSPEPIASPPRSITCKHHSIVTDYCTNWTNKNLQTKSSNWDSEPNKGDIFSSNE